MNNAFPFPLNVLDGNLTRSISERKHTSRLTCVIHDVRLELIAMERRILRQALGLESQSEEGQTGEEQS